MATNCYAYIEHKISLYLQYFLAKLSNVNQFLQSDLATNHLAMINGIAYYILTTHISYQAQENVEIRK